MELRPCDIHIALDKDSTPKDCTFCPRCNAWICKDDFSNIGRRTRAMLKIKCCGK